MGFGCFTHISLCCINAVSIFCTKFHIAIEQPLCYIIIRKGDTNVLKLNGSDESQSITSEVLNIRSCSDNI